MLSSPSLDGLSPATPTVEPGSDIAGPEPDIAGADPDVADPEPDVVEAPRAEPRSGDARLAPEPAPAVPAAGPDLSTIALIVVGGVLVCGGLLALRRRRARRL